LATAEPAITHPHQSLLEQWHLVQGDAEGSGRVPTKERFVTIERDFHSLILARDPDALGFAAPAQI